MRWKLTAQCLKCGLQSSVLYERKGAEAYNLAVETTRKWIDRRHQESGCDGYPVYRIISPTDQRNSRR